MSFLINRKYYNKILSVVHHGVCTLFNLVVPGVSGSWSVVSQLRIKEGVCK